MTRDKDWLLEIIEEGTRVTHGWLTYPRQFRKYQRGAFLLTSKMHHLLVYLVITYVSGSPDMPATLLATDMPVN